MKPRFTLSEVGEDLSHNRATSAAVILVTFVSLLLVGVAGLSQTQAMRMKSEWYDKIEVSIYMCAINDGNPSHNGPEANTEQIPQVRTKLRSSEMQSYVKKVYEESKEEAYENFKRLYGGSTIGQWVSADMIQVSFRIKLVDPEQYSIIKEEFFGVAGVSEVKDQHEITEPLFGVTDAARLLALGPGAVMIAATILLISTTIRLSAMSHEQGMQTMRYVGVSDLFIQASSMTEGALAVVTGVLLAVASLSAPVVFLVQDWLQPASQWTHLIGVREVWIMTLLLILAAVLLAPIVPAASPAKYTKA